MSTEPAIRAALAAIVTTAVNGDYAVNDYERSNINAYKVDGVIRGFFLTNADSDGGNVETRKPLDVGGSIDVLRGWTITGFYQFDDDAASEKTFRAALSTILDALTPHRGLNGSGWISDRLPGIVAFRIARFGNTLVHTATIALETRSEEILSPPTG